MNQVIQSEQEQCSLQDVKEKFLNAEEERIKTFTNKRFAETPSFKFEQSYDPERNQVFLRHTDSDISDPTLDTGTKIQSSLCAALGTACKEYLHLAFGQTINAQFARKDNSACKANATVEALISMAPQDIIEGQLCSRLVILADQYNEYMRRAAYPDQPLEVIERYINCATKLMRVYNDTLEAFNKYRRKGEQKVTVQHVNINGGQAIVTGSVQQGGGDNQIGKSAAHV